MIILCGLFFTAFLSATFLPLQSELVFAATLASGDYPSWLLLLIASCGNTLGAVLNWGLGRYLTRFENRRWFPVRKSAMEKAERWYSRYGQWSLLLSWVPIIGDPLTIAAGVLRTNLWTFTALVALAKTGRYLAIMLIVS